MMRLVVAALCVVGLLAIVAGLAFMVGANVVVIRDWVRQLRRGR